MSGPLARCRCGNCAQLARKAQEVALRAHAPLRGNRRGPMRAQHDASDLALFRSASEPSLF